MSRTGIYILRSDLARWQSVTEALGYGPKSKYKLLRQLLDYAELHPDLFLKR